MYRKIASLLFNLCSFDKRTYFLLRRIKYTFWIRIFCNSNRAMTFPIRLIIYSVIEEPRSTPCKILTYLFPKQNKIYVMVSIILNEYMDNEEWVIGNSCKIWTRKNIGYCILMKFYILIHQNLLGYSFTSYFHNFSLFRWWDTKFEIRLYETASYFKM